MYTKKDFKCVDGFYYIGNVIDVDGNPWVEEEQLELIIMELNNGSEIEEMKLEKSVAFVQFTNNINDSVNYIHLN
jgi:hypothetical protein